MLTRFKIKCLIEIEATIELPLKGYFVNNHQAIRLCCTKGSTIEYIHLVGPQKIAAFLLKHGIISNYSLKGDQVTMYQSRIDFDVKKQDWNVSQKSRLFPVSIADINLSAESVRTIFAREALDKAAGILGLPNDFVFKTLVDSLTVTVVDFLHAA